MHTERTSRTPEPQRNLCAHPNPSLTPRHSPPCPSAFTATIKLAKLGAETLAKRWSWYNSAARKPSGPKHWPPGRPAHDRQQMSTRASPDCAGVKREYVRIRPPTLNDACAHRLDMPRTRTAEDVTHAPPLAHPDISPSCLSAFRPTIRSAELRAETLNLGTQLHGTSPSTTLAAKARGS